jgi:hypothetical protein
MTQILWWLIDAVSRMLEPEEREVVLGDVTETRATSSRALRDVLGLVIRRQAILWAGWRPWLTLLGLILPLGMLLSIVSSSTSYISAIYVWLYANNWNWALMTNPGFCRLFVETIALLSAWILTLVCCSWNAGFVLGAFSRGMLQINSVLLCLMLLFGELVGAPRYFAYCEEYLRHTLGVPAPPDYNAAVFELTFYRAIFPLVVQGCFVALPALWGMRQGSGVRKLRFSFRAVLWSAAGATLAAMVLQERGLWLFVNRHIANAYFHPGMSMGWALRMLQLVAFWPVLYLASKVIGRHRRTRILSVLPR